MVLALRADNDYQSKWRIGRERLVGSLFVEEKKQERLSGFLTNTFLALLGTNTFARVAEQRRNGSANGQGVENSRACRPRSWKYDSCLHCG